MNEEDRAAVEEFARASRGMRWSSNGWFSRLDSAAYFGMILRQKPGLIIEVGSGVSTGIARQAIDFGGLDTRLVAVDPEPRVEIEGIADELVRAPAQTLEPEFYLRADVLFIDSSHIFYEGGELQFLYLEVLSGLASGAVVHSHDIFLPDNYPPAWEPRRYNEQYYLSVYLDGNPDWKIVWPGYYLATRHRGVIEDHFGYCDAAGSFWIERV